LTVERRVAVKFRGVGAALPQPVVLPGLAHPGKRLFVRPRMLRIKLCIATPLRADLEQQDVEPFVNQDLRGDAARRAGANNYRVVDDFLLRHYFLIESEV